MTRYAIRAIPVAHMIAEGGFPDGLLIVVIAFRFAEEKELLMRTSRPVLHALRHTIGFMPR